MTANNAPQYYARCPVDVPPYFTKGKKYPVLHWGGDSLFKVKADNGHLATCLTKNCAYLNGENWRLGVIK